MKAYIVTSNLTHGDRVKAVYGADSASKAKARAAVTLRDIGYKNSDIWRGLTARRAYLFDSIAERLNGDDPDMAHAKLAGHA